MKLLGSSSLSMLWSLHASVAEEDCHVSIVYAAPSLTFLS